MESAKTEFENNIQPIELEKIQSPVFDLHRSVTEELIDRLAQNIQQVGLMDYPVVRQLKDGSYRCISGWLRVNALKKLGIKSCMCKVEEMSDVDELASMASANELRFNSNPFVLSKLVIELGKTYGMTYTKIGKILGKSKAWCSRIIKLPQYQAELEPVYNEGLLTLEDCLEVSTLETNKEVNQVLSKIREGTQFGIKPSREEVEAIIESVKRKETYRYVRKSRNDKPLECKRCGVAISRAEAPWVPLCLSCKQSIGLGPLDY